MREIDTASPVVWPAWCYSGDSQEGDRGTSCRKGGGGGGRQSRGGSAKMTTMDQQGPVKTERLSPPPSSCFSGGSGGGTGGGSGGGGDAASSSSRSGTPSSSYPGTPPGPHGRLSPSGQPPPGTVPPTSAGPTKQIEAFNRNYSDFMRSLAAKYNNNHPNDFFSGRNGFAAGLAGLKTGTPPPPFLLPPPTVPSVNSGKDQDEGRSPGEPLVAGLVGFPPVGDMNATQVLLSMVRSHAGAAHQLETYLKGAAKAQNQEAVPLDLSTSATSGPTLQQPPVKRYKRQSLGESLYGCDLSGAGGLLLAAAASRHHHQPLKKSPGSPKAHHQKRGASRPSPCLSACSVAQLLDKPAPANPCTPDSQAVLHWSVEEVVTFVASLEACAEYAPNFREQRIDGSALPLLTEEHLTSTLGMKLGPALKLRSILSSRLGQCSVCLHCAHCHSAQPPQQQPPSTSSS